jgi:hypothetical protein
VTKDLVNVQVNQNKTALLLQRWRFLCAELIELLSCFETKLTSTGIPVSENLGAEGSCGQSNRSKFVASLVATRKMFVKMFNVTVDVFLTRIDNTGKHESTLLTRIDVFDTN